AKISTFEGQNPKKFPFPGPVYNPVDATRWQADQVASISLLNFAGSREHFQRSSRLRQEPMEPPTLLLPRSSQVMAAHPKQIQRLWVASTMLGLAHGSIFPTVSLEWFGMPASSLPLSPWRVLVLVFHAHSRAPQPTSRRVRVVRVRWTVVGRHSKLSSWLDA
ncbi:hypothetical protein H0H81_011819, partial [Sphagnurus paluster]